MKGIKLKSVFLLRGLFILSSLFYFTNGFSQKLSNGIIKKLIYSQDGVGQIYSRDLSNFNIPIEPEFIQNEKVLWKTSTDLFLGIEGTGIVYKVLDSGGYLKFKRVDKTKYAGSNFCSANFVYENRVHSFGGYGFWKANGGLRTFNLEIGEWDIVPLSEDHPNIFCSGSSNSFWIKDSIDNNNSVLNARTAPAFFWLDSKENQLFTFTDRVIDETVMNESIRKNLFKKTIRSLNLKTREWKDLGDLNRYGWNKMVALPWGLLIEETGSEVYLADVKGNKILKPKSDVKKKLSRFYGVVDIDLCFNVDSTIYFGSLNGEIFDSISLSYNHFNTSATQLYSVQKKYSSTLGIRTYTFFILFVIFILSLLALTLFSKKKSEDSFKNVLIRNEREYRVHDTELFTEVEKGLIQLLWQRSKDGGICTPDDINKILGVYSKNESIKRKVRSETITAINEKWGIANGTTEKLILSQKSLFDKRNREYLLRDKFLDHSYISNLNSKE